MKRVHALRAVKRVHGTSRRARKKVLVELDWTVQRQEIALVRSKGRTLFVAVGSPAGDADYLAFALETGANGPQGPARMEALLDDHSHAVLGGGQLLPRADAVELCRAYAQAWVDGDGDAAERCRCAPITVGRTG